MASFLSTRAKKGNQPMWAGFPFWRRSALRAIGAIHHCHVLVYDSEYWKKYAIFLAKKQSTTRQAVVDCFGGSYRARTCDPLLVRQMLSQLS